MGEVQGSIQVANTAGLVGDRLSEDLKPLQRDLERQGLKGENLRRRLGKIHFKRKTFESAFDRQWIQESAAIYAMTNVQLATEDVAGPRENTFDTALERLARIDFVYRQRPDLIRVSSPEDIERGQREGRLSTVYHLAGVGCFAESDDPLARLDLFYALGVRMSQLTYIQDNKVCCSWMHKTTQDSSRWARKSSAG